MCNKIIFYAFYFFSLFLILKFFICEVKRNYFYSWHKSIMTWLNSVFCFTLKWKQKNKLRIFIQFQKLFFIHFNAITPWDRASAFYSLESFYIFSYRRFNVPSDVQQISIKDLWTVFVITSCTDRQKMVYQNLTTGSGLFSR